MITVMPANKSIEVEPGLSLLKAGQRAGVEMEAGCFNCLCGTCVVEILSGGDHLEPPTAQELEVLDEWNKDPDKFRLACSALTKEGSVIIRTKKGA
jgi:ferredoxin